VFSCGNGYADVLMQHSVAYLAGLAGDEGKENVRGWVWVFRVQLLCVS
jgi:hypothetical protein